MAMTPKAWSVNGLAAELGLDRRTVAKRLGNALPHSLAPDGSPRWRLNEAIRALFDVDDGRRARIDIDEARQRKTAAEARLAELELARQEGEVVAVEDVRIELERRYSAVRNRLMAMPPKLAPMLCPDEPAVAQAMIEAAVIEALAELSEGTDEVEAAEQPAD